MVLELYFVVRAGHDDDRADVAELRYGPLVVVEPSYLPASLFQVLERAG